jgi:hypothetical protein
MLEGIDSWEGKRTYQDAWLDLLLELMVGRRDVHIGRDSAEELFGGSVHYAHALACRVRVLNSGSTF